MLAVGQYTHCEFNGMCVAMRIVFISENACTLASTRSVLMDFVYVSVVYVVF